MCCNDLYIGLEVASPAFQNLQITSAFQVWWEQMYWQLSDSQWCGVHLHMGSLIKTAKWRCKWGSLNVISTTFGGGWWVVVFVINLHRFGSWRIYVSGNRAWCRWSLIYNNFKHWNGWNRYVLRNIWVYMFFWAHRWRWSQVHETCP